jgi:hypothetical protein
MEKQGRMQGYLKEKFCGVLTKVKKCNYAYCAW